MVFVSEKTGGLVERIFCLIQLQFWHLDQTSRSISDIWTMFWVFLSLFRHTPVVFWSLTALETDFGGLLSITSLLRLWHYMHLWFLFLMYKAKQRHYSGFIGSEQSYKQSSSCFNASWVLRWEAVLWSGPARLQEKKTSYRSGVLWTPQVYWKVPLDYELSIRADKVTISGLEVQHCHSVTFRRGRKGLSFSHVSLLSFCLLY